MTIEQYHRLFPNEKVRRYGLVKSDGKTSAVIAEGMLQFSEDSACNLAGPFEGGFAYFAISDQRDIAGWKLLTEAEERQRVRFSPFYFLPSRLWREFGNDAKNEEHLQKRLKTLSPKELRYWEQQQAAYQIDRPTVEHPFAFYVAGNDDSTWTKWFGTAPAAMAELAFLEEIQPLNWWEFIHQNGFVFTN